MQFALVESPAVQADLRLLQAKILTAAALLACLLVRCLAVLFDLEIRLFNWLTNQDTNTASAKMKLPPGKHGYEPAIAS
jgi:hypothetical protein